MGSWFSKHKKSETTENLGNSNINNVIISEPIEIAHWDLIVCIYIITVTAIINLGMTISKAYRRNLKKKFTTSDKI